MRLPRNQVLVGDASDRLLQLPADSVDCVITSPPYYRLRNYGHAAQLGAEPHVDDWVAALRLVMRGVARVLKSTGTAWLNLGDTYSRRASAGAPPKSLLLAPERLALALLDDGWTVRNKIVWTKTNPMPASVADRLTTTWEPILLLSRSRHYFFDLDAIRAPHTGRRRGPMSVPASVSRPRWAGPGAGSNNGLARLRRNGHAGHPLGKNPGDTWRTSTSSYQSSHPATYPEQLIRPAVLAGCPERTCASCGVPQPTPIGLEPCSCATVATHPGIVLDPFLGSGSTAAAAKRAGRDWLGIELNPEYAALAEQRLAATPNPNVDGQTESAHAA